MGFRWGALMVLCLAAGAARGDDAFWSYQSPTRPAVPEVNAQARVRNPIDAFVLAALEAEGLTLSPEADRLTLLRRAHFDLIGLPPTVAEVEAFVADESADAWERLIERLLAHPHYGERWGRHWLDVAGYADSEGILNEDRPRTAAWRYRDYVIRAFNDDKPYDRFLQEQIAGDELVDYWQAYRTEKELAPEVIEALVATGYLRMASDASRPNLKDPEYYHQTLDDTVGMVASATLALTMQCAKCHDHLYDPIPQADYYSFQAIFKTIYRPEQWVPQAERRLLEASEHQERERRAPVARAGERIDRWRAAYAQRLFRDRLAEVAEEVREAVRLALETDPSKRSEPQQALAEAHEEVLRPTGEGLEKVLLERYPVYKTRLEALEAARKRAERRLGQDFAEIRAAYDVPGLPEGRVLLRGDQRSPGPQVPPGVPTAVRTPQPFVWSAPEADAPSSGLRLALARWLTQPQHPLTVRVKVNRIWMHHFGVGIVATPEDFGHTGAAPTHPELLDWLAQEFVAGGWSIKAMHRLIMTSSTYRQQAIFDPVIHAAARRTDPDNRLLWRQRIRRMDAEALRDGILSVAGNLSAEMFGPPVPVARRPDGEVMVARDAAALRRSVYVQVRRSQPLSFLHVFDHPVMETHCTRRAVSTVSSQALTLLNSDFMIQQAELFADRVLRENPDDPLGHAMLLALNRRLDEEACARLEALIERQAALHTARLSLELGSDETEARRRALIDLCHMLLASNGFLYVD